MNDPIFLPYLCIHLGEEFSLLQFISDLGAKEQRQRFDVDKEVFARREPAAVFTQPASCDDVVNVRMIEQLARPGMKHADHPDASTYEPGVVGQFLQRG